MTDGGVIMGGGVWSVEGGGWRSLECGGEKCEFGGCKVRLD